MAKKIVQIKRPCSWGFRRLLEFDLMKHMLDNYILISLSDKAFELSMKAKKYPDNFKEQKQGLYLIVNLCS